MKNRLVIILVAIWMSLMFFGSSIPGFSTGPVADTILQTLDRLINLLPDWLKGNAPISGESYSCFNMVIRKIGHFVEYQILTVLLLRLFFTLKSVRYPYLISALAAIAFAFIDESYQSMVPHRSPLLVDVLVDTAGVLVALILIRLAGIGKRRA